MAETASLETYFPTASLYISYLQEVEASCRRVNHDYGLFDNDLIPVRSSIPAISGHLADHPSYPDSNKFSVLNVHDSEMVIFQWLAQRRAENDACAGLEERKGLSDVANEY